MKRGFTIIELLIVIAIIAILAAIVLPMLDKRRERQRMLNNTVSLIELRNDLGEWSITSMDVEGGDKHLITLSRTINATVETKSVYVSKEAFELLWPRWEHHRKVSTLLQDLPAQVERGAANAEEGI